MTPNKPLNLNLNVYFSLCVWGKVFCLRCVYIPSPPSPRRFLPRIFLSSSLSRCHGMPRFIFGIPWATKTRCQRSSCRHTLPGPFHTATATLASGGGLPLCPNPSPIHRTHSTVHLTPEIDAPQRVATHIN